MPLPCAKDYRSATGRARVPSRLDPTDPDSAALTRDAAGRPGARAPTAAAATAPSVHAAGGHGMMPGRGNRAGGEILSPCTKSVHGSPPEARAGSSNSRSTAEPGARSQPAALPTDRTRTRIGRWGTNQSFSGMRPGCFAALWASARRRPTSTTLRCPGTVEPSRTAERPNTPALSWPGSDARRTLKSSMTVTAPTVPRAGTSADGGDRAVQEERGGKKVGGSAAGRAAPPSSGLGRAGFPHDRTQARRGARKIRT